MQIRERDILEGRNPQGHLICITWRPKAARNPHPWEGHLGGTKPPKAIWCESLGFPKTVPNSHPWEGHLRGTKPLRPSDVNCSCICKSYKVGVVAKTKTQVGDYHDEALHPSSGVKRLILQSWPTNFPSALGVNGKANCKKCRLSTRTQGRQIFFTWNTLLL